MKFSEVIGQKDAIRELVHIIEGGQIPHAILITGGEGFGQLPISLALGGSILCLNFQGGDRCGECISCIKVNKLVHPDLHFSFPFIGSEHNSDKYIGQWREVLLETGGYIRYTEWMQRLDSENKQGNINKEECYNIIRKLSLKAHEGEKKVMVIWLPEFLGKETNRLLKLIEEPPEGTVFILASENVDLLLPTLVSRCRVLRLGTVSKTEIETELAKRFPNENPSKLKAVAQRAMGKWGEALKLMNNEPDAVEVMFIDWMRKSFKGNGSELVDWVELFSKSGREEYKRFLLYGIHFMRGMLMKKISLEEMSGVGEEELSQIEKILKAISLDINQIENICNMFSDAIFAIERNANPKILFLDLSIRFGEVMKR